MARERLRKDVRAKAELAAEIGGASIALCAPAQRGDAAALPPQARDGELANREIEIEVADTGRPSFEVPASPARRSADHIGDMLARLRRAHQEAQDDVTESYETLCARRATSSRSGEGRARARESVEQYGIGLH